MPDLTFARETVQRLMVGSACTVTRTPDGSAIVDVATLELVDDPAQTATVYTGPCVVTGDTLRLPWDAAEVKVDDRVTVTASPDPLLVGAVFRVTGVEMTTFLVWRGVTIERLPRG